MKPHKKIIIIMALALIGSNLQAQQAPMYTHYMYNTLVVNPGYAGSRDALTVTALHRSQWVGFEGAPQTQTLTLHAPLKRERIGLGLSVMNDKIGPVNNTSVIADFAFIMKLTSKSKLALGLGAGMNIFQANLTSLDLDQQNDPAFADNTRNKITPDFGFGAYYSRERFYAGISTPNLLQNSFSQVVQADGTTLIGKEQRHFFLIAGAMIRFSDNVDFKPTTLVKVTSGAPIQADLTASFILVKRLTLGAMYRTGDSFGGLVGFDLTNQLHVGYSYDWSYGISSSKYNNGSHEVMLRYDFLGFGKKQIHSPRYF